VDLTRLLLRLGKGEVPLLRPEAWTRSPPPPCRKGSSDVPASRCGGVVAVRLKAPTDVADSFAWAKGTSREGTGIEKMPPVAEAHEGSAPAKVSCLSRRAAVRRERLERLEGDNVKSNQRGWNGGCRRNRKTYRRHKDVAAIHPDEYTCHRHVS
jgi:hypothetical protein